MIAPADEAAKDGGAGFEDTQQIEFCDGEHGVFGLLRLVRVPGSGRTELVAAVLAGGEVALQRLESGAGPAPGDWRSAQVGPVLFEIQAPLERWRVLYSDADVSFELELHATSAPIDLDEPPVAELSRALGTHGFEQLCSADGSITIRGGRLPIQGTGRRVRTWGVPTLEAVDAARSLYASAAGAGVTVAAVRPAGAGAHDEELVAGHLVGSGAEPLALERVRLSTVYDREGRPREAGLELLPPGEEVPRRVAGEATGGILLESGGAVTWLAFFRWSVDGVPGYGSYQLHRRS